MNDELKIKNNELGGKMNYRYRTDEEMKDSGVEWLGSIPNEWNIKKLKYLAKIDTGNRDTQDKEENGIYPFFVRSDTIERSNTYSFDGEAVLTAGDGVGVAKVFHYINGKFAYHQRVYKISDFKQINGKYLYYYIKDNLGKEVEKISAKTTVDSLRLPMFLNFPVLINEDGGKKISEFLDKKTAQFDSIISKKEALIEKLEEAKKSLISEVVTGKVKVVKTNDGYELVERKKEEMKDSGVEWLGDIPKEWCVSRIKYISNIVSGQVNPLEEPFCNMPHIGPENIEKFTGRIIQYRLAREENLTSGKYVFNKGNILYGKINPQLGKATLVDFDGICSADMYPLEANLKKVIPQYLINIILSDMFFKQSVSFPARAGIPKINREELNSILVTLPTIEEQKIISDMLVQKERYFIKIISYTERQIEKLKEAKQSLISEAVTGKIEILD